MIEIPGHTLGHIALHFDDDGIAFVGDTLFAMGAAAVRGKASADVTSLQRLASMADHTALYCGHEYTLANARFAAHSEPDNPAIAARLEQVEQLRSKGQITLPTTVADERATNPFVRASDWQELARLRAAKDSFR